MEAAQDQRQGNNDDRMQDVHSKTIIGQHSGQAALPVETPCEQGQYADTHRHAHKSLPDRVGQVSLNGFYIECQSHKKAAIGQIVNLALRLPIERDTLRIKAKVVYKDRIGIGCRFVDLPAATLEKLERCFNVFNATLPMD